MAYQGKVFLQNILAQYCFIGQIIGCDMYILLCRLVACGFQELEPNTTHVRCYTYTTYPLKNRLAWKKIVVAVHVRTYLSTSAHPAAQSYAWIRGPRLRRGTIVRGTITTMKENHRERPKQHKEPYLDIRDT